MKTLRKLLNGLEYEALGEVDYSVEIEKITYDSNEVWGGTLFCCLCGTRSNGHAFIDEVIRKGATVIVLSDESYLKRTYIGIQLIKVSDTRKALSLISANFWDNSSDRMHLIGVTGTNGKTSVAHYIQELMQNNNNEIGLLGTTGIQVGKEKIDYKIKTSTTPDPNELHELFNIMEKEYGVKDVVMEATSHALAYDKLEGCNFDIGIFTNFTQDHLDFHKTMEEYLAAKLKLMRQCKAGIINADSDVASDFINACNGKVLTYSIDKASDFQARNVRYNFSSVEFDLQIQEQLHHFIVPVPGKFTVYNALAAIIACLEKGMSASEVKCKMELLIGVPGRMQMIKNNLDINIIVDYAHTPDSLQNILSSVKEFINGSLITVAGCGGNRDRNKRPIMGMIAYEMSDLFIATSDNPRNEYPDHIIIEMLSKVSEAMLSEESIAARDTRKVMILPNRREAIFTAISKAEHGDSVVIAGKGHESYQELRNKVRLDFDDCCEAENIVKIIQNEDSGKDVIKNKSQRLF